MSFNAPFTTLSYYSWLFEGDGGSSGQNGDMIAMPVTIGRDQMQVNSSTGQTAFGEMNIGISMRGDETIEKGRDGFLLENTELTLEIESGEPGSNLQDSTPFLGQRRDLANFDSFSTESATAIGGTENQSSTASDSTPAYDNILNNSMYSTPQSTVSSYKSATEIPQIHHTIDHPSTKGHLSIPTPDAYISRTSSNLPLMTDTSRDSIIQVIHSARPLKPDASPIMYSDPLLSISSLQTYLSLFFTRFNTTYPLIHQASFDPSTTHTYLLLAILLLGATYSPDKEAHLLAVCVHDVMRPLILSDREFGTRPKLWMLQTILLVECFGKSRAGEKQHDMSHLYHGMLINLIRRSPATTAPSLIYNPAIVTPQIHWHTSIHSESLRRLALLSFMWDTQHAVLFSQSLCMNASELLLSLPWDPELWECASADTFLHLQQSRPTSPSYLNILKAYTNPSSGSGSSGNNGAVPKTLNAFSRVLVLHGLLSISWDLNRRSQTSTSVSLPLLHDTPWPTCLSTCYSRWRSDFDKYASLVTSELSHLSSPTSSTANVHSSSHPNHNPNPHASRFSSTASTSSYNFSDVLPVSMYGRSPHSTSKAANAQLKTWKASLTATMTLYHTASLLLHIPILDLQIVAGAKHIIGRSVTVSDRARSRRIIENWTTENEGKEAAMAVWCAGKGLREGVARFGSAAWNGNGDEEGRGSGNRRSGKGRDKGGEIEEWCWPWCLYLCTLVVWGFREATMGRLKAGASQTALTSSSSSFSASQNSQQQQRAVSSSTVREAAATAKGASSDNVSDSESNSEDDDDDLYDSLAEMNALISGLSRIKGKDCEKENFTREVWDLGRRFGVTGLVAGVVGVLGRVRWAVVREGMIVLQGVRG